MSDHSPTVTSATERRQIAVSGGVLDVTIGGPIDPTVPTIGAAHPAGVFDESAVDLLRDASSTRVVCMNPRGLGRSSAAPVGGRGYTLDAMVDDLEAVRLRLGIGTWVFWGMSGGGWLGQIYARKYPGSLAGVILESVCACFRLRAADPTAMLSPFHPSWREALQREGLIDPDSHDGVGDASATEWCEVDGVGSVFRRCAGPALVVSPMPVSQEMRTAMPLFWTVDLRKSLPLIRIPTLVIGGTADPIVPLSHVRSLHEAIAGSRLLMVAGGHVPTTARSPEIRDAVRAFLQESSGRVRTDQWIGRKE